MSSPEHDFLFDVNFAFGSENLLAEGDEIGNPPTPPILGYFLELSSPANPFLLLSGVYQTLL